MKYFLILTLVINSSIAVGETVTTTDELVAAVRDGGTGATIEIGPGTYELSAPLEPKPGMKIRGAGTGKTIITHQAGWKPSTEKLPDSEVNMKRIDTRAYLVRLKDNSADISISNLTLRAPQLHGAIFGTGIRILIFIT